MAAILSGLLARRGKEQQHLAAAVGISRAQISRMLNGKKHWDIDQLTLAAAFLEVDAMEILVDAQQTVARRASEANVRPQTEDDIDIREPRQSEVALAAKRRRKKIHEAPHAD